MPGWSTEVPANPRGPAYPLLRTPPNKPLIAIITSADLIGCYTHYYKGRTVPCEGDNCPELGAVAVAADCNDPSQEAVKAEQKEEKEYACRWSFPEDGRWTCKVIGITDPERGFARGIGQLEFHVE